MVVAYLPEYSNFAAEIEGSEGSAETLVNADATPIIGEPSYDPDTPFHERPGVAILPGEFRGTAGGPRVASLAWLLAMTGSGSAGTPPAVGDLLRSMGLGESISGGTSVTYNPVIAGEAITAAWYEARDATNAHRKQIYGARSRCTLLYVNGKHIECRGETMGVWQVPTDETVLAPTYESTGPVALLGGTFLLNGIEHEFESLEITIDNTFGIRHAPKTAPGAFSIVIAKQMIRGTMNPALDNPATYDWYTKMTTNHEAELSIPLGATPGNIITTTAPKVQYRRVGHGAREGYAIAEVELQFNRNVGGDALILAFT
jgi:hypothetical protein